jgi:hypothetical protein
MYRRRPHEGAGTDKGGGEFRRLGHRRGPEREGTGVDEGVGNIGGGAF